MTLAIVFSASADEPVLPAVAVSLIKLADDGINSTNFEEFCTMLGAGAGIVAMDAREQGWDRNGSFKDLQSRNKNPVQAPQGVNADLFIKTLVNEIFTTGEAVAETARRQRAPDAIDPAFWKDYPVYVGRIVRDNCVLEFNRQVARRANTK